MDQKTRKNERNETKKEENRLEKTKLKKQRNERHQESYLQKQNQTRNCPREKGESYENYVWIKSKPDYTSMNHSFR